MSSLSSIEIPSVPGSYWVSNTTADATNQLESRFPCVYINNKSSLDWLHQQQQRCTLSALCIFQLSSLSLFLSVWTSSKCVIQHLLSFFYPPQIYLILLFYLLLVILCKSHEFYFRKSTMRISADLRRQRTWRSKKNKQKNASWSPFFLYVGDLFVFFLNQMSPTRWVGIYIGILISCLFPFFFKLRNKKTK
jgi:hypothetical protein